VNTPPTDKPGNPTPEFPEDATVPVVSASRCGQEVDLGFLAPSNRPGALGRLGHYEVEEVLGRGGFGIVFRAFDETLHRVVAIKVLAPELAATSPARKRFLREARASAQVRHENVVQVYAIEEAPLPYLVMEYIPGKTLQQRMDAVGPLAAEEAVRIGIELARGLAAAHETGLIHRDVKPGNVLLEEGPGGRAKLTDFGLARAADDASLTQSWAVAGTPQYMAPEQARGEALDHRADLFSLGSVLYAMASGRPPFRAANSMAVLKRVCDDTPRLIQEIIPEVPQWLCDVIARLHAKDPAKRFQSACEVVEALAKCQAPPPDIAAAPPPRPARGRLLVGGAVLLALLAAAGVYWATRDGDSARPEDGKLSQNPVRVQTEVVKRDGHSAHPKDGTQPGKAGNVKPRAANLALKFEGKDHEVWAKTLERNEDTPVTLEGWFKMPGPTPTYRTLLALGGKAAVWIAHSPDTIAPLSLRMPVNSFYLGAKIPFRKWTHVALVYDQRETRFYLNGKLQSASPRLAPPSKHPRWSVGGLIIGSTRYVTRGEPLFGGYFVGQMDEIRVSKVARYKEEEFTPRRHFDPDPDTLALYHCDEGKGERLTDASGNGHHAIVIGASWVKVVP